MANRFRHFLRTRRRPDGSAWTGAEIERATRGEVSRFYVSRLRRGLIDDPGFKKIVAISRAMGIPIEARRSPRPVALLGCGRVPYETVTRRFVRVPMRRKPRTPDGMLI